MNNIEFFTNNLLPVAVSLMVLWVAYRLLFTNSNRFQFNRFYLLAAVVLSALLPLVHLAPTEQMEPVAAACRTTVWVDRKSVV